MAASEVLSGTRRWAVETGNVEDVLRQLPAGCVQTVVTSPPYWGLRDYGVAGQIGLEKTPEEYVERLVSVFREVARVLRDDGTLWLNLGDSYCTRPNGSVGIASTLGGGMANHAEYRRAHALRKKGAGEGLKHKDLIGVPWMVAFALRDDGWWLRMDNVWHKPNAMPESVTDRPTKVHEYMFLLSKSERYYYDLEAVKEPVTGNSHSRGRGVHPKSAEEQSGIRANKSYSAAVKGLVGNRNLRSVWTVHSKAVDEAHFATYPQKLVEPCIAAGTSAKGACVRCGKPWERIVGEPVPAEGRASGNVERQVADGTDSRLNTHRGSHVPYQPTVRPTLGWWARCVCGESNVVPCIVLDPFVGTGTTVMEALRQGRRALGIELKPEYADTARRRIDSDNPMFNRLGADVAMPSLGIDAETCDDDSEATG